MDRKNNSVNQGEQSKFDGWRFIRLIHALRAAGLPVSTQDIVETWACFGRFPQIKPHTIFTTLLVHRPADLPTFGMVWQAMFGYESAKRTNRFIMPGVLAAQNSLNLGHGGQSSGQGSGGVSQQITGIMPLPAQISFNPASVTDLPTDLRFEDILKQALGSINYYIWINNCKLAYQRGQMSEEEWFERQAEAQTVVNAVRQELVRRMVEYDNSWRPLQKQHWRHKPLQSLDSGEKSLVQAVLQQWGRKLAVRPGWRLRPARRGRLDMGQTIKGALAGAGQVFRLFYQSPIPRMPELVVLCDVSNSVAPYVEFLLFLVGRLRARFRRLRLFFFIDALWDVTDHVWDDDLNDLQEEIASWGRKATSGVSDYGQVFRDFVEEVLPHVSTRATLLILGDGKNNYRSPQVEYLKAIREQVRQIIWLNPLNVEEWSDRDNALSGYRPYISRIYRCRTVDDLRLIARRLA